jgi:hypothetical protein
MRTDRRQSPTFEAYIPAHLPEEDAAILDIKHRALRMHSGASRVSSVGTLRTWTPLVQLQLTIVQQGASKVV